MNVVITKSVCSGSVTVPPSKSLFHRALICSALACQNDLISDKYSEIKMINQDKEMILSDDIFDTLSMINNVFCKVSFEDNKLIINALKNKLNDKKYEFKIKESASTLRLILPILFAFNLDFKIECEKSLIKRPLSIYDELFTKMGINFSHDEVVLGKGQLQSGEYEIDGSISSQFISGLLMALPILKENSKLIVNDLESVDYVLMTIDVMKKFGVEIDYSIINDENNKNKYVFDILGNQRYKHTLYQVENDYTESSNFVILGLINNTNQEITIKSMNPNSIQGDRRIINELEKSWV